MMTNPIDRWINLETRRQFFGRHSKGLGAAALAGLLREQSFGDTTAVREHQHFPARAKRVIWLFMAGAPGYLRLQAADGRLV